MTQPTPRPWRWVVRQNSRGQTLPPRITCEGYDGSLAVLSATSGMVANAELIVRAVNSFDALVNACRDTLEALEALEPLRGQSGQYQPWIDVLRDALKLAKGE